MIKILDFFAPWCGPCKMLSTTLDSINLENVEIEKINVEDNDEISDDYQIRSVPTLVFIKDDEIVKKHVGNIPKEKLLKIIKELEIE